MALWWNLRQYPSRLLVRYAAAIGFIIVFAYANLLLWSNSKTWDKGKSRMPVAFGSTHPIKKLMLDGRDLHQQTLQTKRTYDLKTTAAQYRHRRGRHPPPGFDKWFEAARETNAIIVEDYFDRIYKDVAPYWGVDAETLAKRSIADEFVVRVRNGNVTMQGKGHVPWMECWAKLIDEFAEYMPDFDMPVNMMDESRIIVPHDKLAALLAKEMESRKVLPTEEVTTEYTGFQKIEETQPTRYEPKWYHNDNAYWDLAVKACGPTTPAYGVPATRDYSPAAELPSDWRPRYSFKGFIQNWTAAIDPCEQPHLRQLHGTFVEPISIATTDELIPLFSGCKLSMNNELTLPGAMYLTEEPRYSGGNAHGPSWEMKHNGLVWRGTDSGGRARDNNWYHLQRHRLVEMLNGTTVSRVEKTGERTLAFDLPSQELYPSPRRKAGKLGSWLTEFADVALTDICMGGCEFLRPFMHTAAGMPMDKQFQYKFLPDVDGNSFSARFRSFLLSTSLPLKASIYTEWHDDRLTPWVHFVPLDNTWQDLYPALEYFADGSGPGDSAARYIAEEGKKWAEQVLRREDMRLYVWRLLLEWARVCDEKRESLGFIADLD